MSEAEVPRRRFSLPPLAAGLVAGVATLIAIPALFYALVTWLDPPQPFNVEVLTDGPDLSRHGAVRLIIQENHQSGGPRVTAICRGGCDSFGYRQRTGESSHTVQVFDAKGALIAEAYDGYVDHSSAVRLKIGGRRELVVQTANSVGPGKFGPFVAEPALTPPRQSAPIAGASPR